jgi:hypothetical protein
LLNRFRDELNFDEVPIKLYLRRRSEVDDRDDVNRSPAGELAAGPGRQKERVTTPADA